MPPHNDDAGNMKWNEPASRLSLTSPVAPQRSLKAGGNLPLGLDSFDVSPKPELGSSISDRSHRRSRSLSPYRFLCKGLGLHLLGGLIGGELQICFILLGLRLLLGNHLPGLSSDRQRTLYFMAASYY